MRFGIFLFFCIYLLTHAQDPVNKFKGRSTIHNVGFGLDATESSTTSAPKCYHPIDIIWHKKFETPFFSTPIITDLFGDGRKDIIAVGLDYVFALAGDDGDITTGDWPVGLSQDEFIASPLLYDVDADSTEEIVLATMGGSILFVTPEGFVDVSRILQVPPTYIRKDWYTNKKDHDDPGQSNGKNSEEFPDFLERKPPSRPSTAKTIDDTFMDVVAEGDAYFRLLPELTANFSVVDERLLKQKLWEHFSKKLTPEGLKSLELFLPIKADISLSHQDYASSENYQKWRDKISPPEDAENYFAVPPHLLSPPVIADIESDGHVELVVAVSYYFGENTKFPPESTEDPRNYVASGVVVFDLSTMDIKWLSLLDLTTDYNKYKGYVYASPTVVDLDDDGQLETIVGTGTGLIYVLDSQGMWISEMGQMMLDIIYGGITAEDMRGDGTLQLLATDIVGNIVCFNNKGEEIWENQVSGVVHQNPVIGDVNADGILDVVVATTAGAIYAFSGDTGSIIPHFPVKTGDPIYGQPLLLSLNPGDTHMSVLVHTRGGYIFIVNAFDGCVESIDIGGGSFSMLITDDLTGNGKMDLVATTEEGDIYLLGTEAPYHPLNIWTSPVRGRNVHTVASSNQAVLIDDATRNIDQISGKTFLFVFSIIDQRKVKGQNPRYNIQVLFGGQILFNNTYTLSGLKTIEVNCPKSHKGAYLVTEGIVKIQMVNEHGQVYYDQFHTNFNRNFHKTIKWILVIPFFGMCFGLAFVKEIKQLLPK